MWCGVVLSGMSWSPQSTGALHHMAQARMYDEESEALDSAQLKYLSLSRDSPVETRVYASQDLADRAAGVALHLFDSRVALKEAVAAQQHIPQAIPPRSSTSLRRSHPTCDLLSRAAHSIIS